MAAPPGNNASIGTLMAIPIAMSMEAIVIPITTLSGGFLVNNWLACEQQMLRDIGFSVFCRFNSKPT